MILLDSGEPRLEGRVRNRPTPLHQSSLAEGFVRTREVKAHSLSAALLVDRYLSKKQVGHNRSCDAEPSTVTGSHHASVGLNCHSRVRPGSICCGAR